MHAVRRSHFSACEHFLHESSQRACLAVSHARAAGPPRGCPFLPKPAEGPAYRGLRALRDEHKKDYDVIACTIGRGFKVRAEGASIKYALGNYFGSPRRDRLPSMWF